MHRRGLERRIRLLLAGAVAVVLIAPAGAAAQNARPDVTTRAAANVAMQSATLTGTVNPNGGETTYFFQYGTTVLYGANTPEAGAGAGRSRVAVAADVGALAPATTYHYRLVARNARGIRRGADRTFRTQRQPLGLSLSANPNPVAPGGSTALAGALTGTGNADRRVVLQANPFPYTQGFQNASDIHLTNATGGFTFPVLSVLVNTQYRVVLPNQPEVVSPIVGVGVAAVVTARRQVRRGGRRARVRFYGRVRPAHDGAQIAIQRLRDGNWVTINGTVARHARSGYSRYSKRLRLRRGGTFRILAGITDGDHVSGASRSMRIRVRR
jgi:hypothetical protein